MASLQIGSDNITVEQTQSLDYDIVRFKKTNFKTDLQKYVLK